MDSIDLLRTLIDSAVTSGFNTLLDHGVGAEFLEVKALPEASEVTVNSWFNGVSVNFFVLWVHLGLFSLGLLRLFSRWAFRGSGRSFSRWC